MPKFNHLKQPFYYVHSRFGIQLGQGVSAPQCLRSSAGKLEAGAIQTSTLKLSGLAYSFTWQGPGWFKGQDCQPQCLHMVCLCNLAFFILWPLQGSHTWRYNKEYSIGKDRSCITSGVTNHHSHFILLVEAALSPPWFKRKSHGPWLLMEGPVLELLWCVQGAIMITMMLMSYRHTEQSWCSKDHSKLSSCINSEFFRPKAYHYSCFPGGETCTS